MTSPRLDRTSPPKALNRELQSRKRVTGERVQLFEGHEDQVMWLCFSADGQLLAREPRDGGDGW